ncbi:hypothetical protein COU59_03075 [Candidatus Pacearchaeota archaeon CG10_big_fil_rev_8_21_14_0_10_34_12]|nr:MAG: hypothetical protein COU59_03075 [Candidatus Pacearchaeota archaeon CG10_big_fil_rev_8_21_14_0_10_34_12]
MKQEIIVVNPKELEEKKRKITKEGLDKLHIVADFDKTLTTLFLPNGNKVNSLISILRNGNYLDEDYVKRANELFSIYHPIEINSNLDFSEKKKKMHEWWEKHFTLLGEKGLDKELIKKCVEDIIKDNLIVFRQGVWEFVNFLDKNNIPLLIISASIGDLIREFMREKGFLSDDIYIISNELNYDSNGKFIGVKKIVHVLNKDESAIKNFPKIYKKVEKRKNVLLLGDGIGDVDMVHGFEYDNLIKIGFLNENIEKNLEEFKKHFDVVLTGDQDFSFVNKFVRDIK